MPSGMLLVSLEGWSGGTNDLGKDALGNSTVRDPSSPSYSLL